MIVDGDPAAAALRDVPLCDLIVDPHAAGPHHDVGGQEHLITENRTIGAHFLHRCIKPQVDAAPFQ